MILDPLYRFGIPYTYKTKMAVVAMSAGPPWFAFPGSESGGKQVRSSCHGVRAVKLCINCVNAGGPGETKHLLTLRTPAARATKTTLDTTISERRSPIRARYPAYPEAAQPIGNISQQAVANQRTGTATSEEPPHNFVSVDVYLLCATDTPELVKFKSVRESRPTLLNNIDSPACSTRRPWDWPTSSNPPARILSCCTTPISITVSIDKHHVCVLCMCKHVCHCCTTTRLDSLTKADHASHIGRVCLRGRGGVVVRFSAGSLPDFSVSKSCRTTPLVGGFSRGSPVSPTLAFRRCYIPHFTLIGSQDLDVKSRPNLSTHSLDVQESSCFNNDYEKSGTREQGSKRHASAGHHIVTSPYHHNGPSTNIRLIDARYFGSRIGISSLVLWLVAFFLDPGYWECTNGSCPTWGEYEVQPGRWFGPQCREAASEASCGTRHTPMLPESPIEISRFTDDWKMCESPVQHVVAI
ncbi:hypothetical protein PR048_014014 [Dryococelus australis]|uniref:Uncharacterized protein n=1 Tax=Dryococelus australis TaxID=614101 RepID=A0ABQ9HUP7_9NEOP|nr:hypothetical protein PR048_014014 [Dryococelus australis]